MADYDQKHRQKVMAILAPAVLSADNTPAALDTDGYKGVTIGIHVGIGGITFDTTNKIEFKLTHCDTSNGTYTAVTDDDVLMPYGDTLGSGGIIRSLTSAKAAVDSEVYTVGYRGKKRYLKLLADFSGTHGVGTPISAFMQLSHPMSSPANEQSSYETQTAWPVN